MRGRFQIPIYTVLLLVAIYGLFFRVASLNARNEIVLAAAFATIVSLYILCHNNKILTIVILAIVGAMVGFGIGGGAGRGSAFVAAYVGAVFGAEIGNLIFRSKTKPPDEPSKQA